MSSPRQRTAVRHWVAPLLIALFVAAPVQARAQHLRSDAPEAWAMYYFTSATMFSAVGAPHAVAPGSIETSLELGWIPSLSKSERTVGFDGTKTEDLNKAPLFLRPSVTVGLPARLSLSLAYVPPIRVFGVKPNLLAAAVERMLVDEGPWSLSIRLHGQTGDVRGAFTCPARVTRFPPGSDGNPYGCETESKDSAKQRYLGMEVRGARRMDRLAGLTPWLALGANYLDAEFHVHAETFGFSDRSKLRADGWTFSMTAGLSIPLGEAASLAVGLFYSPLWVTRPPSSDEERDSLLTVRTQLTYRVR